LVRLTVAIATYGREQVMINTLAALLGLKGESWELLLVDQTAGHEPAVEDQLQFWEAQRKVRRICLAQPTIPRAMNCALQAARGSHVLFLDDDISPDAELLVAHQAAVARHPDALIAGRVLQPWHGGQADPIGSAFRFNSLEPQQALEFMGCNVCIPRLQAIGLGGFDQNFIRVAYRFEAEFAYRWRRAGFGIEYEPAALIHHLKAPKGGTRMYGKHPTTLQPSHAVGRYYELLRTRPLPAALGAAAVALVRSVCSRFHLQHPWWIPLTAQAELRGLAWALALHARGSVLLSDRQISRPRFM
jgi:glycosyltransferase involved in cell wall biosynthesis